MLKKKLGKLGFTRKYRVLKNRFRLSLDSISELSEFSMLTFFRHPDLFAMGKFMASWRNAEISNIWPLHDSEQIGYIYNFGRRTFKLKVNSFPPLKVFFSVRSSAIWLHGQINNICNISFVDQFNGLTRILVMREKRASGNINIVSRSYRQVHGKEETKVICKKYCFGIDLCFEINFGYFGNFLFFV